MVYPSDTEIFETVARVQASIPELSELSVDQQRLVNSIAGVAAKSVIELIERNSKGVISLDTRSPFPLVFAEWAQQYMLKTHFDRYLAIAVYLRDHENVDAITTTDIARMYDKSRWKKPANLADVFAKAAERILFVEAENESAEGLKLWKLTRSGHNQLMSLKTEV